MIVRHLVDTPKPRDELEETANIALVRAEQSRDVARPRRTKARVAAEQRKNFFPQRLVFVRQPDRVRREADKGAVEHDRTRCASLCSATANARAGKRGCNDRRNRSRPMPCISGFSAWNRASLSRSERRNDPAFRQHRDQRAARIQDHSSSSSASADACACDSAWSRQKAVQSQRKAPPPTARATTASTSGSARASSCARRSGVRRFAGRRAQIEKASAAERTLRGDIANDVTIA